MEQNIYLVNMFPDYAPPEELAVAVSQAAIVAADIDTENRRVSVALHAEHYIPQRLLDQAARDISFLYGLRTLELTAAHPASELHRLEPGELMQLFVSRNSMTRGSLAGAQWQWQDAQLTIRLRANGKKELEDLIPTVQTVLRERFAAPVTICVEAGKTLEGQDLFAAMDSMRDQLIQTMPAAAARQPEKREERAAPAGDTFYGKPFAPQQKLCCGVGFSLMILFMLLVPIRPCRARRAPAHPAPRTTARSGRSRQRCRCFFPDS